MATISGKLFLGTSGWMYKDWGTHFYPKELKRGHLAFLAKEFNTVEVNSSFYHLPLASTFKKWAEETPSDFFFSLKLSRFITHQKRLLGIRGPLEKFIRRARPMKERMGAILIQLPPSLEFNKTVLYRFLQDVRIVTERNYPVRFALEPRHQSWMDNAHDTGLCTQLAERHMALVFPDSENIPSFKPRAENITAGFIYVRFHGPKSFASSRYGAERLRPWSLKIRQWLADGYDVYVYFNNDVHGHAVFDARTLARQLGHER